MPTPVSPRGEAVQIWEGGFGLTTGGAVVEATARTGVVTTRTGTGTYTVRLPVGARGTLRSAHADIICADGGSSTRRAIVTGYDGATRALTLVTQSAAGTAADIAAGRVSWSITLGGRP